MAGRGLKNFVVLAALLFGLAGPAAAQLPPRVPLIGYVDRTGKVVEPATYENGSQLFLGDWVAVSRKGKAGYLNLRTRASTGLLFEEVAENYERPLFANGPEPARIGGKWGFVDESGRFVIPPRFDSAQAFEADGLAVAAISEPGGGGHGFIDKSGRFVVPPKYALLRPYKGGLAAFRAGSGVGAIDREGREVVPARFVTLGDFGDNGLAPANAGGYARTEDVRLGYVDRTGRFVTPRNFVLAGTFIPFAIEGGMSAPDGHALVRLENGQPAYLDSAGKIAARFPEGFSVMEISANGLIRVQDKSGKYGSPTATERS
jgi:WG containing repeat